MTSIKQSTQAVIEEQRQYYERSSVSQSDPLPSSELDTDVAIVGGGIAGLTLASVLQPSGLRITVLEARQQSEAAAKGQAYHFSLGSGRIFEQMGLWAELSPQLTHFQEIRLSDAQSPQVVSFRSSDLDFSHNPQNPDLGYVAEHWVLLSILQNHLQQCPQVQHICPAEVVAVDYGDDYATVTVQQGDRRSTLRSRLVVAADGSRSRVRRSAGIQTQGWPYWQSCITCMIRPARYSSQTAYERFWPSGPFAILPLANGLTRIVWTSPHAEAQALMQMEEQEFLRELQKRYGDQMGELSLASSRFLFPVQLMQSQNYVKPRLALVGDAAHACHPVGGQGLNMGIGDVTALGSVLQEALQQGEDIGNLRVLQRYERRRRWENLVILGFTDLLDRTFSNDLWPLVRLRRLGLWALVHIPLIKSGALRLMTGYRQPR